MTDEINDVDKLEGAHSQAQAQFESIKEMVEALEGWESSAKRDGWTPYTDQFGVSCWRDDSDGSTFAGTAKQLCEYHDIDVERDEDAEQRIHEDALSVARSTRPLAQSRPATWIRTPRKSCSPMRDAFSLENDAWRSPSNCFSRSSSASTSASSSCWRSQQGKGNVNP